MSAERPVPETRHAYAQFIGIDARWSDNDIYGHVNNVVYYSWFDTAVNRFLIEQGALDIQAGPVIGLVVESQCRYFAPLSFPCTVQVGLRVGHRGRSSVRYDIGVFQQGAESATEAAAACGHFIHVYVDRASRRPVASLPPALGRALDLLQPPFRSSP